MISVCKTEHILCSFVDWERSFLVAQTELAAKNEVLAASTREAKAATREVLTLRVDNEGRIEATDGMTPPNDLDEWLSEQASRGVLLRLEASAECSLSDIAELLNAANAAGVTVTVEVIDASSEGPAAGDQSADAR